MSNNKLNKILSIFEFSDDAGMVKSRKMIFTIKEYYDLKNIYEKEVGGHDVTSFPKKGDLSIKRDINNNITLMDAFSANNLKICKINGSCGIYVFIHCEGQINSIDGSMVGLDSRFSPKSDRNEPGELIISNSVITTSIVHCNCHIVSEVYRNKKLY